MTKLELIEILSSINFVCEDDKYDEDREAFEPLVTTCPEMGVKCLNNWMSKYYVSLKSKALIEKYEANSTWDNFHKAAHFLMLDRVIAAVALEGQVVSRVEDCIKATLKCGGQGLDDVTLYWVEFYTGCYSKQQFVA